MKLQALKKELQSFRWRPKAFTIKSKQGGVYLFFNLKRYEVSGVEGDIKLTARDGREHRADRLFYKHRQLT